MANWKNRKIWRTNTTLRAIYSSNWAKLTKRGTTITCNRPARKSRLQHRLGMDQYFRIWNSKHVKRKRLKCWKLWGNSKSSLFRYNKESWHCIPRLESWGQPRYWQQLWVKMIKSRTCPSSTEPSLIVQNSEFHWSETKTSFPSIFKVPTGSFSETNLTKIRMQIQTQVRI